MASKIVTLQHIHTFSSSWTHICKQQRTTVSVWHIRYYMYIRVPFSAIIFTQAWYRIRYSFNKHDLFTKRFGEPDMMRVFSLIYFFWEEWICLEVNLIMIFVHNLQHQEKRKKHYIYTLICGPTLKTYQMLYNPSVNNYILNCNYCTLCNIIIKRVANNYCRE